MKRDYFVELVYDSMQGSLVVPLPQVENEFAPGSRCEVLYGDVLAAYGRLCQRLGQGEEDPDVEIIIDSFLQMQRILCMKMYEYGAQFGNGWENRHESRKKGK